MREIFGRFARMINRFSASPQATGVAFACVLVWAALGPSYHYSDAWQLVINTGTTIVTFLMVFVLNNAQARDTDAVNAKLDAIILALENADNRLVGVERKSEAQARAARERISAAVDDAARNAARDD